MNKKKFASVLAGVMAAVLLLTLVLSALPGIVGAEKSESELRNEISQLQGQKNQIDSEIKGIQAKIDANMNEIEKIVAQKNAIDQEIALLHQKLGNINDQIAAYSTMIAEKQAELDEAMKKLEELKVKYKERIRAMEENGTVSYWSVLFQANDFADLLDRLNMVDEIAAADQRRLAEIREVAEQVKQAKAELEARKAELEKTRTELVDTQKELEAKQAEADAILEQLLAKGAEFERYMEEAEDRQSAMVDDLRALEKDLDAIEKKKYEEWLATQPSKPSGGAGSNNVNGQTWIVPINYTWFSSPFGMRLHPTQGIWKMHNGVDLSAPSGTPIYATRSGVISYAGYNGSCGNYVTINHQDGYKSRYMHMTHYVVSSGQWVSAGQVIGYCGSTGDSTGPHLHFEIEYNGSFVNPANYINI